MQLQMFDDSSQDVLSAVAFFRKKVSTDDCTSTELVFVCRKAWVAPMKALMIPKLVIQALLLAARLRKDFHNAITLEIDKIFMWTDSTAVLHWLHLLEKQPIFVANFDINRSWYPRT